jgi:outer membrane lipoprotein-sorting protein
MLRRLPELILLTVILSLLSCFPKRIPLEERTPARVLDKLLQQENKLHSSANLINFRAKNQKESISSNLELYWTEPDSFAFYFQSILGTTTVRGRLIEDTLELYFADENRYFKGDSVELDEKDFFKKNVKEILNLAVGKYGLEKEKLTDSYPQGDKIVYRFEDERKVWELWVDSKKNRVEKGTFFLKNNKASYNLNFKSYFENRGFKFPRLIEIYSSSRDEYVKLKFIERKVNYPIPPNRFELKIPQDAVETDSF